MATCMIVDDSKTIRKIISGIIHDIGGFDCSEAEDGQVACNKCEQKMPELIMLDWNMPVMDGLQCLVRLRSMENGLYPKIIFCTTENDISFIQKAMEAGADEYIMKPFDRTIIEGKLIQLGLKEEQDL